MMIDPHAILIGLAGGTGSGKTSIAKAIKREIGDDGVVIVEQDSYYHNLTHLPIDERARINFDPAQKVGPWVMNRALEHGLIVRALVNDTIAFCPPLIIEKTQIEDMFDCFERTLDDVVGLRG